MTGALAQIDIVGRGGMTLRDDWAHGPRTYLGLGVDGFPNLFVISGPGAPAVLANMVLHAEAQVNWIADAIRYLDDHGYAAMEPTTDAWTAGAPNCAVGPTNRCSPKPTRGTWARTFPAKPRVFMLFIGGFATYNDICAEVAGSGYKGFALAKYDVRK